MVVVFVDDWQRLDPAGGGEAKGVFIPGRGWSGGEQKIPSGSESLISARKPQRNII